MHAARIARCSITTARRWPRFDNDDPTPHEPIDPNRKFGTVGAVALDQHGHVAAATSTGGVTNKQVGRVGDTPLIGAGCYADDATCAVSTTGSGEMFMRACVAAYDVAAQMAYRNVSLEEAAHDVVMNRLPKIDGHGGLIAVDARGNIALPFNTEGMYRGFARIGETPVTAIYRNAAALRRSLNGAQSSLEHPIEAPLARRIQRNHVPSSSRAARPFWKLCRRNACSRSTVLSVTVRSGDKTFDAVRDLSLTIERGETLAIIGESGSGKSVTSLRCDAPDRARQQALAGGSIASRRRAAACSI